jgi:hypothetical protein
MPALQSCYFCGTTENVREYAVIPPRFTPDTDDSQSAVLCDQCKTKLLQVVEPLTDQLENGPAGRTRSAGETVKDARASTPPTDSSDSDVTIASQSQGDGGDASENVETGAREPAEAEIGSAGESTPPSYRRAMRMLSNREFPLPRSEVESMLAGAYDLERHELKAVLDHAVETGRLREEDGQFYES